MFQFLIGRLKTWQSCQMADTPLCCFNSLQVGSKRCNVHCLHKCLSSSFNSLQVGSKRGQMGRAYSTRTGFNSLQVGSKPDFANLFVEEIDMFQFLIGRLKTNRWQFKKMAREEFQFLIGRLKTIGYRVQLDIALLVSIPYRQAQNWSFSHQATRWNAVSIPYRQAQNNFTPGSPVATIQGFNSLQVGSKLDVDVECSEPQRCFNSLQVGSKPNGTAATTLTLTAFQFLIGRLKTNWR